MTRKGSPLGEKEAGEPANDTALWDFTPWGPGSNKHQRCSPTHTEASHSESDRRPMTFPDNVLNKELTP